MGQITLRKSTTGTVVNHKEESSLRGEEFVIGGKGRIPTAAAEAGSEEWTCPNVWRFPVRACPRPPAHLYCHLETNEGVHQAALALPGQSIGRWWWRNDCCPNWRKRVHLLKCSTARFEITSSNSENTWFLLCARCLSQILLDNLPSWWNI